MASIPDMIDLVQRRQDILRILETRPREKRTLIDETDSSRTTITRALESLEQAEIVTYSDGKWRLTLAGRYVLETYEECHEHFEELFGEGCLATELPYDSNLERELFEGAEIERPELPDPHAPLHQLENLLQNAEYVHGLSPVVFSIHPKILQQTKRGRLRSDIKLYEEAWKHLNESYRSLVEDLKSNSEFSIEVVPSKFEYSLVVLDGESVWIGVHNDCGQLTGAAVNRDDDAVYSAERLIEAH